MFETTKQFATGTLWPENGGFLVVKRSNAKHLLLGHLGVCQRLETGTLVPSKQVFFCTLNLDLLKEPQQKSLEIQVIQVADSHWETARHQWLSKSHSTQPCEVLIPIIPKNIHALYHKYGGDILQSKVNPFQKERVPYKFQISSGFPIDIPFLFLLLRPKKTAGPRFMMNLRYSKDIIFTWLVHFTIAK